MITDDPDTSAAFLDTLRRENERLRAERDQLLEEQHRHLREIESLQHQLQSLLRRYYGRSAEKIDPKQLLLFEELLQKLAPETPAEAPVAPLPPESPKPANNGHGRRRLPATTCRLR